MEVQWLVVVIATALALRLLLGRAFFGALAALIFYDFAKALLRLPVRIVRAIRRARTGAGKNEQAVALKNAKEARK